MKGIFFQQTLEFKLETAKELWHQGESLNCSLSVKNRGAVPLKLEDLYLQLALGDSKKIKQQVTNAFIVLSETKFESLNELGTDMQDSFSWIFNLDKNSPISDKGQSLYLICGRSTLPNPAGQLPIMVKPHKHIQILVAILESNFSFVLKGEKSNKGWLESKFVPPAGLQYPRLEHLILCTRFEGDELQLKYRFQVKNLHATPSSLGIKKSKKEVEKYFPPDQYLISGGFINEAVLEDSIKEALSIV